MKTLNDYCAEQFGGKAYRLSINAGFTCPNRDGRIGTGGCIFCSEGGSGDFAAPPGESVAAQLERAKERVRRKYSGDKFIAYFQAFTNTYAPVERLRELFTEAISAEGIVALSIATRPDCLPDEVIELLSELNRVKPVWVELGLQTANEKTARFIRRGYGNSVYVSAVKRLNAIGVHTVTHIILALPGETREDMLQTVRFAVDAGTAGIKLQLLHVLRGTELAGHYAAGEFALPELEEYAGLVADCVELLPENTVVHRLTGDGPKRLLIAPLWSGDKKRVINAINAELKNRNLL